MAIVVYDQYGRRPGSNHYGSNVETPEPYRVDEAENIIYICYFDTPQRAVRRITTGADGSTTIEWAHGAWDQRSTLDYQPVNDWKEVEE